MYITLIRHGRSKWQMRGWMTGCEFAEWVKAYDAHGILEEDKIPEASLETVKKAALVISSPLPRAVQSVERLQPFCHVAIAEWMREVDTPIPFANVRWFCLPVSVWLVFSRICWLCGYSLDVESYREAKRRAEFAADMLCEYAERYGHIVAVGHGWFHRLVSAALKKKGWKRTASPSAKHWHAVLYTFYNKKH
ncbi:phosphoglycerate kinase [Parageobacillus thermoglucosidasius]|uniref:phosphoglycerate kinase n=1 Tax=Parageobacillus thermoglucosidasius TaxID=1426 RepID=UPI0001D18BE5|nr:phosphoglycerate kinase [Parageobacillus thermoglucosidasius]AEH47582.1 Phosphoglycerate mutase [Parageobacillus thermoglucosidasius C56-YS93]